MRIPAYDEPEPDMAIVRGSDADYEHRIPTAADVALLVEVSGSTLKQDRGKKRTAYARGRIPVYWIVNLVNRQVEVYSRPGKTGYKSQGSSGPASKSRLRSVAANSPRSPSMTSYPDPTHARVITVLGGRRSPVGGVVLLGETLPTGFRGRGQGVGLLAH